MDESGQMAAYVGLKTVSYVVLAVLLVALAYAAWMGLAYWPSIGV